MARVLVIGLDGATWDLLMPLADEGFLPTLKKLINTGSYGELDSTIPPVTGPAWASFATGKNPGKTGVFDFLFPKGSLDNLTPATSGDICGKTFYEILYYNRKRTIMVNLPLSYPPRTGDPTITSILTQGDQYVFPENLKEEVPELEKLRLVPNFDLRVRGKYEEYFADIRDLEKARFEGARKLFERGGWDFFFLLFSGTDWVQHEVYDELVSNKLDTAHPARMLYRDIDTYISWFLSHLDGETTLLILSDHGFATYHGTFHINQWLKEKGFLKLSGSKKPTHPYPHRFAEELDKARSKNRISLTLPNKLLDFLRTVGLGRVYRLFKRFLVIRVQTHVAIDCSRTYAFCTTSQLSGIYLNLADRFENGVIKREDASNVKSELIRQLIAVRDPANECDAFDKVVDSAQVYSGEKLSSAPDILLIPKNLLVASPLSSSVFKKERRNGHSRTGILLAYGPGVKRGHRIEEARLYDIAPTVLHIFNVGIPKDMDGRVLTEIFEEGSELAKREIIFQEAEAEDEKERIKRRIRQLEASDQL